MDQTICWFYVEIIYSYIIIYFVQILENELEEVKGLDGLKDFIDTFTLDQGKKATDEEGEFMGEFKVR